MPESEPQTGTDVTARLVEELTRTNQRLERLEAALSERSLLPGIQEAPERTESAGATTLTADPPAAEAANGAHADGKAAAAEEADAHFRRGVDLCQAGKYDEAMQAWQEVLKLQPDNAYALANIGILLTEQGRWAEARQRFVRVLDLQPENAEAYYGLGMAEAQMGNYAGAIAAWENTIRLQPDNTDAHYNITLVRRRLGQQGGTAPAKSPAKAAADETAKPADGSAPKPEPDGEGGPDSRDAEGSRDTVPTPGAAASALAANEDLDDEEEPDSDQDVRPRPSMPPRDWKRVDSAGRSRGNQSARGAGRLSRPPSSRGSRSPVGLLLAAAAIVAGAFAVNYFWKTSRAASAPNAGNPRPTARVVSNPAPQPGQNAARVASSPVSNSAGSAPAGGASRTTVVPVEVAGTGVEPITAEGASGPARPGKMQIRLANGLTGQFRYWFVSGSNRAASMRWLPRANRSGIIALWIPAEYNGPGAQLRILDVRQGKVARLPVTDVTRTTPLKTPNVGPNLLRNADFSQGPREWAMENTAPGRGTLRIEDNLATAPGVTGKAAHFEVTAIGKQGWNVQCYQMGVNVKEQEPYLLSFWAKSDRKRPLHVDAILDKPDWHPVGMGVAVSLGTSWQKFMIPFNPLRSEPSHTRVSFILGESQGPVDICGISLRRRAGATKSVVLSPDSAVTVTAGDFN